MRSWKTAGAKKAAIMREKGISGSSVFKESLLEIARLRQHADREKRPEGKSLDRYNAIVGSGGNRESAKASSRLSGESEEDAGRERGKESACF